MEIRGIGKFSTSRCRLPSQHSNPTMTIQATAIVVGEAALNVEMKVTSRESVQEKEVLE
jgi:hypothetical protein